MKSTKKTSLIMLVGITVTILLLGLFWPQGFFYVARPLASISLLSLICYTVEKYAQSIEASQDEKLKNVISTVIDDVKDKKVADCKNEKFEMNPDEAKKANEQFLESLNYYFGLSQYFLESGELNAAKINFEKGKAILDSFEQKMEQEQSLECDVIILEIRIKIANS